MKDKIIIIEKAWEVNASNLEEPWFTDDSIVYGTRGQAKRKILSNNDCATILGTGKEVTYTDIKIQRNKNWDKVEYLGKQMYRWEVEDVKRFARIADLPKDKLYYVQDARNYVGNAVLWWTKDGKGYVCDIKKAHKYTWQELQSFSPRDTDIIWESEHVENAIKQIVDRQYLDSDKSV